MGVLYGPDACTVGADTPLATYDSDWEDFHTPGTPDLNVEAESGDTLIDELGDQRLAGLQPGGDEPVGRRDAAAQRAVVDRAGDRIGQLVGVQHGAIESVIRNFLAAHHPDGRRGIRGLASTANLWREVSSLSLLQLVAYVETKFEIAVRPIDFAPQNFGTVAAIVKLVETRQRSSAGTSRSQAPANTPPHSRSPWPTRSSPKTRRSKPICGYQVARSKNPPVKVW